MNAQRVVSLLPSATEILFALGVGDRVVGVTHECDYPPEARERPHLTASTLPEILQTHPGAAHTESAGRSARIDRHVRADVHAGSSLYHLDDALLDRLAPDLIVTQELCAVCAVSYDIVERAVRRLRGDPRIVSLEPSSLDDVWTTVRTLGTLTGAESAAEELIAAARARLDLVRGRPRIGARVLVLEWTDPPMSAGHWIPELVTIAGAQPVLSNAHANSRVLTPAEITAADPDCIIVAPCGYDLPNARAALAELRAQAWFTALRAVADERVYPMDGSAYVNRPGPRLVDTAEQFADMIAEIASKPQALTPSG